MRSRLAGFAFVFLGLLVIDLVVSCAADPVRSADAPAASTDIHRVLIDSTFGVVCYGAMSMGNSAGYSVSCVRFR